LAGCLGRLSELAHPCGMNGRLLSKRRAPSRFEQFLPGNRGAYVQEIVSPHWTIPQLAHPD
jgi:hypothetical protein